MKLANTLMKGIGDLTWDAEGQEGGKYHSRKLHVPPGASGLTLGRGYDMREKTAHQVLSDLTAAGIDSEKAKLISKAVTLKGKAAKQFIEDNGLQNFEIDPSAQEHLFKKTYGDMVKDVARISSAGKNVAKFGKLDFNKVDPKIVDMLVDLRFRGDYTEHSREIIQKAAASNDLKGLRDLMANKDNWKNVPADRFKRRLDYLDDALAKVPHGVPTSLGGFTGKIGEIGNAVSNRIGGNLPGNLGSAANNLRNSIPGNLSGMTDSLKKNIPGNASGVAKGLSHEASQMAQKASGQASQVMKQFGSTLSKFSSW